MTPRPQPITYRTIWEKHNGAIPPGYHIHHIDGDSWNNDISNLQCVSPYEHYLIHKRQGDIWAANMLLRYVKFEDVADYNYFPTYGDHKLARMNHGLIKVPRRLQQKGHTEPEIILMDNLDWVMDDSEPYEEKDVELVNQILSQLTDKERVVLETSYGINTERRSIKDIAIRLSLRPEYVRQLKHRIIKKLKNDKNIQRLGVLYSFCKRDSEKNTSKLNSNRNIRLRRSNKRRMRRIG